MSKCKELGSAVIESVQSDNISGVAQGYAEVGIDMILTEGVLKDIPLVNTIVAIGKVGVSMRDRLLIKKLIKFLGSLNELSADERQDMVTKLESNEKYGRKVGEHLIEIFDRIDSQRKPEMLALVFTAYAKEEVDTEMLLRLIHAIETLPVFELKEVRKFNALDSSGRLEMNTSTLQALMTAGFANAVSGYGTLVYKPSEVCVEFVRLSIDRQV